MEKIANYIKSGKGNGLLFLLASAVLVTIFILLMMKHVYSEFRPKVISGVSEILPVTIENGKVVQPTGVYKRVEIRFDESNSPNSVFPVVVDTRAEVSELPKDKSGLFIMTDALYLIAPNEIKKVSLTDGVWNIEKVEGIIDYFSNMISFVASGFIIIVLFILNLLKTFAAALISKWGCEYLYKKEQKNLGLFMRMNAIFISLIELMSVIMGYYIGIRVGWFSEILMATLFSFFVINKNKKFQN